MFQDKESSRRKTTAGRDFNWSVLYMNSLMQWHRLLLFGWFRIVQADILKSESDNAAVKFALAEMHIIHETKSYLESQGIVLSSLFFTSDYDICEEHPL